MLSKLKGPLTAAMVSSLALVPAAAIAFMATAEIAIAKSDNAGGNGKGHGGQKSVSGSSARSSSSGGGGKSRGHGALDKLFGKITGQATASAKKTQTEGEMHPSQLGKMNGALNANVNALIAHVKNGNTNGPIGGMAALAVAGYAADGAAEIIARYEDFAALDQLLIDNGYVDADGSPDLQAYLDALEGVAGNGINPTIEDAIAGVGTLTLEEALLFDNNGVQDFATLEEYEAWRDGTAGADPIEGADTLITDLEGQERPTEEEVDFAEDRIEDRTSAEDYMLSIWNKGDGDDSVRSESEEELLTLLYDRIAADGETLDMAIEEHADLPEPPAPVEGEVVTECAADDLDCAPLEEVAAAE